MLSLSHKIENVFLRGVKWLAWVTQLVGFKYRSSSLQSSVASQSLPKMELLYSSTCNVCPHRRWGLKMLSDLLNGVAVRNNHRAIVAPIPTLVTNSYLFSAEDKELHQILCVCPVAWLCPILCNPLDNNPPGSAVHGSFQARILEWVVISSFKRSSQPRDWIDVSYVSCIAGEFFTTEPLGKPTKYYRADNM